MESRLVIFDCDGTLVDSEIIAARVFPEVWASMGVEMTADYFLCHFVGVGPDAEIVQQTKARLPAEAMPLADQRFEEEVTRHLQAVPGIPELLAELPHLSCVASNSSLPYVKKALAKTDLTDFFGGRVYSSRDAGRPKPAPDVFLRAAHELGFPPSQCLVVEDSRAGVQAARSAGMPVVAFMGGGHCNPTVRDRLLSTGADWFCSSTTELKRILLQPSGL